MSFIDYKEKVFCKKNSLPRIQKSKKKKTNTLSFICQSTDPRAWSLDLTSQRDYFLEVLSGNLNVVESVSRCSVTPRSSTVVVRPTPKRVKAPLRRIKGFKRKCKSADNLIEKDVRSNDEITDVCNTFQINKLITEKGKAEKAAQLAKEEVENLRKLVKDVQEELSWAHNLKSENIKLRAEINSDLRNNFMEAQDEINYLSSQLEIFKKYRSEYTCLKESYYKLKEENQALNMKLLELGKDKRELEMEVEVYHESNHREVYASNAIVDRDVLRERIQLRDEKINFLLAFLEEQENTINDLAIQLERLTANISAKEAVIGKQMDSLKCCLNEKNSRIIYLEDKLHTSELIIRELENLREQFRLANAMLHENMLNYKTQFNSVVSCSEKLLAARDVYEKQIEEKETRIKKLSIFPQSPKTVVYLSQILHILKQSEESVSDERETIFSYVPSIRRIIETMKSDLWNGESVDSIYELRCITTQTEIVVRDSSSQHEISFYVSHKLVEANIPDRYYLENENLRNDISEMQSSIDVLEEAYRKKDSLNKDLERKLISAIDEKSCKEKELGKIKMELELAQEKLLTLQGELAYNDSLLKKALVEIEIEQSVSESTSDLLSASLDSTLQEYNKYVGVLELYITEKEQKIDYLEKFLNDQLSNKENFEGEYISKLENEIKRLTESNAKEKQNVQDLNSQIHNLKKQLSDKRNNLKIVQDKLEKAERLFEKIDKLNNCTLPLEMNENQRNDNAEPDQIVARTSEKILLHSERLENHWKEEEKLKEKLLKDSYSQKCIKAALKTNRMENKKLKLTIMQLRNNIARVRKLLNKSKNKIKISETTITNYQKNISELKTNIESVNKEKHSTHLQLKEKSQELEDLKTIVQNRDKHFESLNEEKIKMESVLLGIISSLEQSTSVKSKESIGTITDAEKSELQIKNLTSKNNELSSVIAELQERLDSLLYVPQKETQTESLSVSVQADIDNGKKKVAELESHYKNIIEKLEEDYRKEKQLFEQEHITKLQAYKRDLKLVMKSLQENLVKLQKEHAKEISNLKLAHEEKLRLMVNRKEIEERHRRDLERQKKDFENMFATKEEELNTGINELRIEITNIISKKEEAISKLKEATRIHINYIKKKYKKNIKKLKNELKLVEKNTDETKGKHEVDIDKTDMDSQTDSGLIFRVEELKSDKDSQTTFICISEDRAVQCHIEQARAEAQSQTDLPPKLFEQETNTDDYSFRAEKGKMNHIVFGLPPNKSFDINYKESIKCSIKETKSTYIGELFGGLPAYGGSGDAPVRDICLLKDKNALISHIEQLENDLLQKTEDFNRNVFMYQETIRRQKSKIKELENSLDQETLQTYHLQHRLGLEFSRAEQLQAERLELQDYVESLQKLIQDHEIESYSEREKYNHLKNHFNSVMYQRKTSDQLEESLKRLKEKLETAVEYEKRLTQEIEENKKESESSKAIAKNSDVVDDIKLKENEIELGKCGEISNKNEETKPGILDVNNPDLKVVFIQQCEFRRMWSRRILESKYQS